MREEPRITESLDELLESHQRIVGLQEQRTQRHQEQFRVISEVGRHIVSIMPVAELLVEITRMLRDSLGYYLVGVALIEGNELAFKAGAGAVWENPAFEPPRVKVGQEGITGWVAQSGEPFLVPDVSQEPRYYTVPQADEICSELAVPLKVKDTVIGVLHAQSDRLDAFDDSDLEVFQSLAYQAAVAIENARLYEQTRQARDELETRVQERTSELEKANEQLRAEIAERKRLEQQIEERRLYLEHVLACAPDAIVTVDAQSCVVEWNEGAERLFGYLREEVLGKSIDQLLAAPDDTAFAEASGFTRRVLVGEMIKPTETVRFHRDGRPIDVVLAGAPIFVREELVGFVAVYTDITERKQAERLQSALYQIAAITNSKISLEELYPSIHQIVGGLMDAKNFYVALHEAESDLVSFPYFVDEFDPTPDGSVKVEGGLTMHVLHTGEPLLITQGEHDELIRQGKMKMVGAPSPIWLGVPLESRQDGVFGVMAIQHYTDVGAYGEREKQVLTFVSQQVATAIERKRAEEALKLYTKELAAAVDRLEELDRLKNEFIQNVSHELRQPLALIRGHAELLAMGELGEIGSEQQESVNVIVRRTQMLGSLVEDIILILLAEQRVLELETVSFDDLVRAGVEDFLVAAERAQVTLTAEIADDLPPINGEPTYLRRVLDNLVGNAIKFTPAGGEIVVRTWQQADEIYLQVTDTGIGIPTDQLQRVFGRFYQVDGTSRRRYEGVGLGLALVKELVELHDGRVRVESTLGQGSTFTVCLPISAA